MSQLAVHKIRAAVILINEDRLLLARQNNRDFWVLPGGTQELDEGLAQCAGREMKEETGLDVEIGKLLYLADFMHPERHCLDAFFLGRLTGGALAMATDENLNELDFYTREQVMRMHTEPQLVFEHLLADWERGFPGCGQYLGCYGV